MRKLFKSSQPSVLSNKVNVALQRIQALCVQWIQKREAKWSMAQKRLYLGIFLTISSAACVAVFLSGLYHRANLSSKAIVIIPMRTPIIQEAHAAKIQLNADDTVRVLSFLHLVDSLQKSPEGRKQLDNYFQLRPGMRDSIPILKSIFK